MNIWTTNLLLACECLASQASVPNAESLRRDPDFSGCIVSNHLNETIEQLPRERVRDSLAIWCADALNRNGGAVLGNLDLLSWTDWFREECLRSAGAVESFFSESGRVALPGGDGKIAFPLREYLDMSFLGTDFLEDLVRDVGSRHGLAILGFSEFVPEFEFLSARNEPFSVFSPIPAEGSRSQSTVGHVFLRLVPSHDWQNGEKRLSVKTVRSVIPVSVRAAGDEDFSKEIPRFSDSSVTRVVPCDDVPVPDGCADWPTWRRFLSPATGRKAWSQHKSDCGVWLGVIEHPDGSQTILHFGTTDDWTSLTAFSRAGNVAFGESSDCRSVRFVWKWSGGLFERFFIDGEIVNRLDVRLCSDDGDIFAGLIETAQGQRVPFVGNQTRLLLLNTLETADETVFPHRILDMRSNGSELVVLMFRKRTGFEEWTLRTESLFAEGNSIP